MKRIIGIILLVLIFALFIGITCYAFGWKRGMIMWGISFAVTLIIIIAVYLIVEGG